MKLFVDAYGDVALLCIRLLLERGLVNKREVFVRTYDLETNKNLIEYLKSSNICFTSKQYDEEMVRLLCHFRPEFILSLFGRARIPIELIDDVRWTMNLHPSLLPKYKGCFSVPWSIINDEKITGITFHEISQNFDEGKILFQRSCEINDYDTAQSLYARLNFMFYSNFLSVFEGYVSGDIIPQKQDGEVSSYYPRKLPYNGVVDPLWDKETKSRFLRAMYFPPFLPAVNAENELQVG